MKVLITGANGYIGARLLPVLLDKGHEVTCLVRDERRFMQNSVSGSRVQVITGDLLKESSTPPIPMDIDAAYYLVNGSTGIPEFSHMEALCAHNFVRVINPTHCKQLICLSDNENNDQASQQTTFHKVVEGILREANAALTILRSSVIIGAGSPAFEIIRNMVERLPVLIAPGSVKTRCQPIATCDVLTYLESILLNQDTFNQTFEIGGPDILSFKELVLIYVAIRGLKRRVIVLPFSSHRLSVYWLRLISPDTDQNAHSFLGNMEYGAILMDHRINEVVPPHVCLTCRQALTLAINGSNRTDALINAQQEAKPDVAIKKQLH